MRNINNNHRQTIHGERKTQVTHTHTNTTKVKTKLKTNEQTGNINGRDKDRILKHQTHRDAYLRDEIWFI